MKLDYDYDRPILYSNLEEQQEAYDLRIKKVVLHTTSSYPVLGIDSVITVAHMFKSYHEHLQNAIPWPELKAQLMSPPIELYL